MSAGRPTIDTDRVSIELLESAEIDPNDFNHDAHVYVGWCYLQQFDLLHAVERFRSALIRLTRKLGVPDKYHETVTWFFLILIAERRRGRAADDWQAFYDANRDLFGSGSAILTRHYSEERLMSPLARQQFLLPDKSLAA
ncbi:MAG: hypothetical protein KJO31_06690 [Gammaproteobacteria bacterium]|nr:hypothetical protein [Gammaproteobacteria bacterium]